MDRLKVFFLMAVLFLSGFANGAVIYERVSNTGNLSGQPDGIFPGGDRENSYAWCMDFFPQDDADYLYVGSNRNLMYVFLFGAGMPDAQIQALFQGDIASPSDLRARIYRYKLDGSADWEEIYVSPGEPGAPRDLGYRGSILYSGETGTDTSLYMVSTTLPFNPSTRMLKFPADFQPGDNPSEVLRLLDPLGQAYSLRAIATHEDRLYVSSQENNIYFSGNPLQQPAGLLTSTEGWDIAATDADFGNAWQNWRYFVWQMESYNGYLYAFLGNIEPDPLKTNAGFLVFKGKYQPESPFANTHGWVWQEIVGNNGIYPAGLGKQSNGAVTVKIFREHVYVGTMTDTLGPLFTEGPSGIISGIGAGQVYRFDINDRWELVIGDTNEFFPQRLGNYGAGFFNRSPAQLFLPAPYNTANFSLNQYIWWMDVYKGKLYCTTFDLRCFLKYINDETLQAFGMNDPEERQDILDLIGQLGRVNDNPPGFDMYVTSDGLNWSPVTRDGFGDEYNYGGRTIKSTGAGLFVGTANPFWGCQVWRLDDVSGGGGSNCFIATAAFGTPMSVQVNILRAFRDRYLLTNKLGRFFIRHYYSKGPFFAGIIERNENLRSAARLLLYPLIVFAWLLMKGILIPLFLFACIITTSLLCKKNVWKKT
ncbi:MAG TPA: hypothetical protein PKN36_07640 [bacterium]|nr:hypothetical protein [bacterium]